jgi:RNA polymerase sigma-70 factor (ECF subfamily)
MIDGPLLERLYRKANAASWRVPVDVFRAALESGAARAFAERAPARRELERHLEALHLEDLALACACAAGDERAWEHFIAQHRPVLYRSADALDASGRAREIADSLYAELYGLRGESEGRASLFRYFHGRSSLATWLRAVLSQRYVDRLRNDRRASPLDDHEPEAAMPGASDDPERLRFAALVSVALRSAIGGLAARDRLRLRAYYEQDLTLAQVGRLTGEHEATVSRQIARSRKILRQEVERRLRDDARLPEAEIATCVQSLVNDAGPIDMRELFGSGSRTGKIGALDRSE